MDLDYDQLHKQALSDLTNRAKGGIALYPAIWLVITLPYQVNVWAPMFFYINTGILCCIFILRLSHFIAFRRRSAFKLSTMRAWLVTSVILAALHWGIMSAIILLQWHPSGIHYIWIIALMAIALGGGVVLSISNRIRLLYPLFLMVPSMIVLIFWGEVEQWTFAASGIISLVYIHITTKVTYADYWEGVKNRFLAEQRVLKMEQLSNTDQLTQLNNRMFFDKKFREEWKRSLRSNSLLSILMLDLDHFKAINDSYGHVFGDECLRLVAATLLSSIKRETDSVARYGGEEFVILLPDTNQNESEAVATRILLAIADIDLKIDAQKVPLTCSIGTATAYSELNLNREILLKSADDALYRAKNKGRNRVELGLTINTSYLSEQ
jgi:diguanylate cyclase (GGDEF)-like protein